MNEFGHRHLIPNYPRTIEDFTLFQTLLLRNLKVSLQKVPHLTTAINY